MAKILWIIHNYPPYQSAGAEWMAKEINDYLIEQDHAIGVCAKNLPIKSEGVEIHISNGYNEKVLIEYCDIIITHLDESERATQLAKQYNKSCINIIHHNWEIPHLREANTKVLCVYNSQWIQKDRDYPHESIVLRPPVNPERFKDINYNANGYITLVNCNADKGALIFQNIARAMPDKKFLAVKGAHGPQLNIKAKNLVQWECQDDIREVLKETSFLLIPSIYESYGRIGIEAMACGIPVIATDTPGLKESLGRHGTFVSRNHIPAWMHAIRRLEQASPFERAIRAESSKIYAVRLWERSLNELEALNNLINSLCQ